MSPRLPGLLVLSCVFCADVHAVEVDPVVPVDPVETIDSVVVPEAGAPSEPPTTESTGPIATDTADADAHQLLSVSLRGGLGLIAEVDRDDAPLIAAGVALTLTPLRALRIDLESHFRSGRPTYLVREPVVGGVAGLSSSRPIEHFSETALGVSGNLLAPWTDTIALNLGADLRLIQTLADGFDTWALAAGGRASLVLHVSDRVDLDVGYAFATRVGGAATVPHINGLATHFHTLGAGITVAIDAAGHFALEVRYDGRIVVFELAERHHHSWLGGARFSF